MEELYLFSAAAHCKLLSLGISASQQENLKLSFREKTT